MRKFLLTVTGILCALGLTGCGAGGNADAAVGQTVPENAAAKTGEEEEKEGSAEMTDQGNKAAFTADTKVWDVINDPAFEGYGRLLFPADKDISDNLTLGDAGGKICNHQRGRRFYVCAAMHDSFPHAQELSKKGYNAFALIYRPGAQTACEDLSRAVAFIHEHAEELEVDVADYSLWGGSAGARMAAWVGTYGTAAFGQADYPGPGAVIMQYTGLSEVTGYEPPTYACVGTGDGIAYYGTMEDRIEQIRRQGTNAEIEVFDGLPHGFGLGEGTAAEGWIDRAAAFWEENMS